MSTAIYDQEMISFLRQNMRGITYKDLTKMFNIRFGLNKSVSQIRSACVYNKIYSEKFIYTQEMLDFLAKNIQEYNFHELTMLFNNQFHLNKSVSQLKAVCLRNKIYKKRFFYTREMVYFLRDNIENNPYTILTSLFNDHFGLSQTANSIVRICHVYGIKRGRTPFTQEMVDFLIQEINQKLSYEDITKKFNEHFKTDKSIDNIRCACNTRGLKNGLKSTKGTPKPMGSERVKARGTLIKVAEPNKWSLKQRFIWQEKRGPIPHNSSIIFADGNKNNFDEENLLCVNSSELQYMKVLGLRYENAELTKIGLNIAKLQVKISDFKKGKWKIKKGVFHENSPKENKEDA